MRTDIRSGSGRPGQDHRILARAARTGARMGVLLALLCAVSIAGAAHAEDDPGDPEPSGATALFDALVGGTPTLNVRARIELADQAGLEASQAYTVRTRLGYGSLPWHGLSAFAEFENTAAIAPSQYYNGVEAPTGQTLIADPTNTAFNQVYVKIAREDLLDTTAIGGRQRIVLDNARFVGNVGFRQNEQTYAAGWLDSSLGIDGLSLRYAYIGRVFRIWGGQGDTNPSRYDWASNSQVVNASYQLTPEIRLAAFAYLFEFDDDDAFAGTVFNSSASYGVRLSGLYPLCEKWSLAYDVDYAYQTDYGNNPLDYGAQYALVDVKATRDGLGSIGAGYERLGSDGGEVVFVTPLATAHKFDGWADVFTDNGQADGLQDFYASVAPSLPWKLQLVAIYHHFRSAEGGDALGNEIDAELKRPLNAYLTASIAAAYFDALGGATKTAVVAPGAAAPTPTPIADLYRVWFTLEFAF